MAPISASSQKQLVLKGSIKADVYGDKEMVKFMLRNLMHNALKFAPSDGLVEIEIKE